MIRFKIDPAWPFEKNPVTVNFLVSKVYFFEIFDHHAGGLNNARKRYKDKFLITEDGVAGTIIPVMIIKYSRRLSHDVITCDVDRDVSTASC